MTEDHNFAVNRGSLRPSTMRELADDLRQHIEDQAGDAGITIDHLDNVPLGTFSELAKLFAQLNEIETFMVDCGHEEFLRPAAD